jgi:type II secretory pathway pseudopilin PulG
MTRLRGFTLLEAIVYVAVLSIVGGVITSMIMQMYRFQSIVKDRAQINTDVQVLFKSIRDDMYLGDSLEVTGGDLYIYSSFNFPAQVRYFLSNAQVYRQENADAAVQVTHGEMNVKSFDFQDISTPASAGVIRVSIDISNYPRGPLKPEVEEQVTSTISLKFL